jgi:hypothetical protein
MALFTDGPVSTSDDLSAQDSQLADVALAENIDVTRKLSLAQDELALELITLLTRSSFAGQSLWLGPNPNVGSVVATPALRLWHTYRALEMVYADAYNSQLNDRYAGKRDQFRGLASWAYEKLLQIGVGVASDPIPRAVTPNVMAAPGAPTPLPDGTYYATVAWTNRAGEEGASAPPATITTSGTTLSVHPINPPANAVGWNVYVGSDSDSTFRQNGTPIGAGQTWTQPGAPATTGKPASEGQAPSYVKPVPRVIQRG